MSRGSPSCSQFYKQGFSGLRATRCGFLGLGTLLLFVQKGIRLILWFAVGRLSSEEGLPGTALSNLSCVAAAEGRCT